MLRISTPIAFVLFNFCLNDAHLLLMLHLHKQRTSVNDFRSSEKLVVLCFAFNCVCMISTFSFDKTDLV